MNDCIFCRIVEGGIEARMVEEDDRWVAFHDVNPQAPLHVLIVPREHIATLNEVEAGHDGLLGSMIRAAAGIAAAHGVAEDGYRLVLNTNPGAGQSVFHVHLHLLGGRDMSWPPG